MWVKFAGQWVNRALITVIDLVSGGAPLYWRVRISVGNTTITHSTEYGTAAEAQAVADSVALGTYTGG